MTLTNPFDRAPAHVWAQVDLLNELHAQRVAEAQAQPEPEPELPPADSSPEVADAAIAGLTQELDATPLHDETMREHVQTELDYFIDLREFYRDDWKAIHAEKRQAERVARAQAQKEAREAAEKAQALESDGTPEKPTASTPVQPLPGVSRRKDFLLRKKQNNGALQRDP